MTARKTRVALLSAMTVLIAGGATAADAPQPVRLYAAGSLRGVVTELAAEAGPALGVEIRPSFGGSGSMRERIEKGEPADLLMSADMGSPRKLEAQGRTIVPVIAFARNRMCIVSRSNAGVTAANLVERMLAHDMRLKTSTPVADPSGDYAWSIIRKIGSLHPGAQAILERKAQASMGLTAKPTAPGQSATGALFASNTIDMSITYCSGTGALLKEAPDLTSLPVPAELDPHPVYGVAVLSARPAVLRLALYLLSEKGQAIIAKEGLVPVTDSVDTP